MYRILLRDAVREEEVRPYQEADMSVAASGQSGEWESETADPGEEGKEENKETEENPLATAQQKAEEILTEANRRAETVQQESYQQGLSRGLEEGREAAKKELHPVLSAFAQAGQSLATLEKELISGLTPEIVHLALEIAEKLVDRQVKEDPQIVASVLERALAEVGQARNLRICLNPADHRILVELRPELVSVGEEGGRKIEVLASEEISPGGCRVETEIGVVDATIPVQMREIGRQMLDGE